MARFGREPVTCTFLSFFLSSVEPNSSKEKTTLKIKLLWWTLAVIVALCAMLPVGALPAVAESEEYEEVVFVLPVNAEAQVGAENTVVHAAGAEDSFVTIKARLFKRQKRLVVSAFAPRTIEDVTFQIKRNGTPLWNGTADIGAKEVELYKRDGVFEFGDLFNISAKKNTIISEVFLEALEASPVHVWLLVDGVKCIVIRGHNDPEILVRILRAGTDQVLKEEHHTRTSVDWEVTVSETSEALIDVEVVVSSAWSNGPAGKIRGHYKFLNVPNPCFAECKSIVNVPANGALIAANTAATVTVQADGVPSVQVVKLTDSGWEPASLAVPVVNDAATINYVAHPNTQYAIRNATDDNVFVGCSWQYGELLVPPQCLGAQAQPAAGAKIVSGDVVTITAMVTNTNSAQLVLLDSSGGVEQRLGSSVAVSGTQVTFSLQPIAHRQYAVELRNEQHTIVGCPVSWDVQPKVYRLWIPFAANQKPALCTGIQSDVPAGLAAIGTTATVTINTQDAAAVAFAGQVVSTTNGVAVFMVPVTEAEHVASLQTLHGTWESSQCSIAWKARVGKRGFGEGDPYWVKPSAQTLEGDLDSSDGRVAPRKTDRGHDYQDYRVKSWRQSYTDGRGRWAYAESVSCHDAGAAWKTVIDFYSPNNASWQSHTRFAGDNFRVRNLSARITGNAPLQVDLYSENGPSYAFGAPELQAGIEVDGWQIKSIVFRMETGEEAQAIALIRPGVEIWLVRQPDGYGRIEINIKEDNTCNLKGLHGIGAQSGQVPDPNAWVVPSLFEDVLAAAAVAGSGGTASEETVIVVPEEDWTDNFPNR